MKQYQKEVEQYLLQTEQQTLKQIKADYTAALKQVNQRIDELTKEHEAHPELIGKVYQRSYQEKLKKQLETALAELPEKNLEHTTTYLQQSYQDAFIGANYSTLREGYDLFLPYDTEKMIKAIYNSPAGFKISGANYEGDIRVLRKKVQSALSRGLASGMDYHSISQLAASKLNMGYNNMRRIIATEGHRVQNEAKMDCMNDAKAAGADIVKEWSAVMDSKTRPRHSVLDGQVRELDEPFTAMGADVMYPGGFGIASEDIHCRCCLLQRSRRTLSEEKTRQLKNYAAYRKEYIETSKRIGEIRVKTADGTKNVNAERLALLGAVGSSPKKVQDCLKDTSVEIGRIGASAYDYENDILYVAKNATREEIIHEIGHAIDAKLIDSEKRDTLLRKAVEGLTISDVSTEIYYDASDNAEEICIVHSDRFISEYQGRIYVKSMENSLDEEQNIRVDCMLEYISEGYREYIVNGEHLKEADPELYSLLEEVMSDDR